MIQETFELMTQAEQICTQRWAALIKMVDGAGDRDNFILVRHENLRDEERVDATFDTIFDRIGLDCDNSCADFVRGIVSAKTIWKMKTWKLERIV